jgi:hypothetical protein
MKLRFLQKYPFMSKQDRIFKKYQLAKPVKVWKPTRQNRCMPGTIVNPDVDLRFTDGSGINDYLMQVLFDQLVTIGKVFLWATSLQCF